MQKVISAKEIMQQSTAPLEPLPIQSVLCPHCFNSFNHSVQYTHGDPRNLGFIGHWDGW